MSDDDAAEEKPFAVERAKTGRAKCKKCKCPIDKDQVRIAKLMANPFGEGKMKAWHHVSCLFEVFSRQRATTKRIEDPEEDISGWNDLCDEDKDIVLKKLKEFEDAEPFKAAKAKANAKSPKAAKLNNSNGTAGPSSSASPAKTVPVKNKSKDDTFYQFQRICDELSSCSSYLDKTAIVKKMFTKGSGKDGFKGDIILWCKLLLPGAVKRIYNLQSKALIKLFARILDQNENEMLEDLEQGDVAMTIKTFYESSTAFKPCARSDLTLQEVDAFLEKLTRLTKEDEQIQHFKSILRRCTANDLKMIIRLIKHDLRINAGPKHILGAVHDDAYTAFQVSRDLPAVIERCLGQSSSNSGAKTSKNTKVATLALMTPVLPMLAEACKDVYVAMEKCPNGMLSEVKYDGERVQVHKRGKDFLYFSRSLKPVLSHKVNFLKEFIPKAFPQGDDLILDSEVLLINPHNGRPLPFGSLGVHKQNEFKDGNMCLFIFDIIYYNGESLLNRTMNERRKLLEEKMTPIPNRIMLSVVEKINDKIKLAKMIANVINQKLEGLVLKNVDSKYEPGKRHWLKVKRDYLCGGKMADSADLVVLGGWYGTGQKGGMMSSFLMGCYDPNRDVWVTVVKASGGHDDKTLAGLQTSLDMVKIGKDPNLVPKWLKANKQMVPDFVARDPKKQPVWEIIGAEFTKEGVHTADAISIRFPRIVRIRDDKDWKSATNLPELRNLVKASNDRMMDYTDLLNAEDAAAEAEAKASTSAAGTSKKRPSDDGDGGEEESEKPKKRSRTEPSSSKTKSPRRKRSLNDSGGSSGSSAKSPVKSPSKVITQYYDKKKKEEVKKEKEEEEEEEPTKESKAEYYSFIGTDYIEYSAAGSPLNWVAGRKPPKRLPDDAKPISERDEVKMRSRCLLYNTRIYLADDLVGDKRKAVQRTLKTLGATVLSKVEQSQAQYVIHGRGSVPATIILEPENIPKSARRVKESWLDVTMSRCKVQSAEKHAVTLSGVYCSCPCDHHD